jgi:hypothetical protein
VSEAIAERAAAIRQSRHLREHPDQPVARKYSFLGARFEQLKLQQIDGQPTPADDQAFLEVSQMLRVLTRQLGLGEDITDAYGYLIKDPQRLLSGTWLDCARMWFGA